MRWKHTELICHFPIFRRARQQLSSVWDAVQILHQKSGRADTTVCGDPFCIVSYYIK